jgi:transcriptional regulator GlxA family with amidase domain
MSVPVDSTQDTITHAGMSSAALQFAADGRRSLRFPARGLSQRALCKAIEFIDAHLAERFTLEDLANAVGVSRYHFARQFRISTGRSPMVYQMHVRLERGKQMLARGDRSICDIAATLGFCDQSHFTRTFRRVVGLPPRDYVQRASDGVA